MVGVVRKTPLIPTQFGGAVELRKKFKTPLIMSKC